ncbi:HNH endonuclease [Catellatospora citrea]|uniref:HNH endonuclease n=1 Tax=Catellatospora citrea TaxID=53366 RepID=UPI0033BFFEB0
MRVLLTRHLADLDHAALLADIGLAGYDSAAGVPTIYPQGTLADGSEGETARRAITAYRVVRDSQVAKAVKELHDHHCQVCGLRLQTSNGGYSEAAHIRGLGAPHHGPDRLTNLLCLCPNHHVLFDTFTIYIDRDGIVRGAADGSPISELRYHARHRIDPEHVSYHRQLCGQDV